MDLTVSVVFDKPAFLADEIIIARARVTNTGTAAANWVNLDSAGYLSSNDWGIFGKPIAPGQTVEGTLTAELTHAVDPLSLSVTAESIGQPDANPTDNTVTVTVPIIYVRGSYLGTVYADRNGSADMDAGEEFPGLAVTVTGGRPHTAYTATTDSAGRFAFHDLPRGKYGISFADPEWAFRPVDVQVDGTDDPDLLFRAAHLVNPLLSATAAFDRQGYRTDDTAHLTLTLTNSGSVPIPGITAWCVPTGSNIPLQLGELTLDGPGATVPANASRAFDVQLQTNLWARYGYLKVECAFGEPPYVNGDARASAIARITGVSVASVTGQVRLASWLPGPVLLFGAPPGGLPIPNMKVYLKDRFTGAVSVRATTDANGVFEFHDVQTGLYDFAVVGPWLIISGGPDFPVMTDQVWPRERLVFVVPGPDQPDPDPAGQPGPGPGPDPRPDPGPGQQPTVDQLAATGVNVTWLALGGLVTLLAGVGLMSRNRRRAI